MTTPTQAPPAAVEQLSELPEFELRPDGSAHPLTAQNQVAASPQASPNGAGAETAGSTAETATQPAPTQQPTQPTAPAAPSQPAQPVAQQPVVQVVPPTQPASAATQAQPEPTPTPATTEPTPEELVGAESRLDTFLEQERQRIREEVSRATQSAFDKRAAQLDRQLQEASTREKALATQIRELQTQGLSEDDRAKVLAKFAQEDERAELDAYRGQLVDYHKNLMVQSLLVEFAPFGVQQDALEQFDSPEEMEVHCYEQKANFLETQNQARTQATQPAATTVQPTQTAAQPTAQPAQAQPAQQPQPNVPAGATAPVDIGGGGVVQTGPKFNQGEGQDALRENLKQMRWETVRITR